MNKIYLIFILAVLCININAKTTSKKASSKKIPELKPRLPHIIYYYVDKSTSYKNEIEYLISNIQAKVCIKFVKKRTLITGRGVNFLSTNKDSDIKLYNDSSKPTNIYLKVSNSKNKQQLPFFIGMALGLIPEITRYDRDKYVKVNLKNVKSSFMKYYIKEKKEKNYFGSFDYGSVMALDNLFGSIYNKTTYTFNFYSYYHPPIFSLHGLIRSFTFNDYRRLNYMYCKNDCPNLLGCNSHGYPNEDCSNCICGPHFLYPSCEMSSVHTNPSCGKKTMYISHSKKSYLTRKNVTGNCCYRIKSSNGKKVAITIKSLVLPGKYYRRYVLDIYYRSDRSVTPLRLRHNNTNFVIPPSYKEVYLVFHDMISPINFSIMYHNTKYK
uniref:Metalloendopeptidase n=1 Tax=Strongyloides papillosus TaxID=174720 RepID=A0A0N5CFV2_STREA